MKFGNIEDKKLANLAFSLPADNPANQALLASLPVRSQVPCVYIGCSVWTDRSFLGKIYPQGTATKDYLKLYSNQLNTVELNATFYSTPAVAQINKWKASVATGFKFCPKVPRSISHSNKLDQQDKNLHNFLTVIQHLGETLGTTFLQLPPDFQPNQMQKLQQLLALVPPAMPWAVEFRHPAWFSDPVAQQEIFDCFRQRKITAVISDVAGRRDILHQTITNNCVFIRFRGYTQQSNNYTRLNAWIARIKQWTEQGLEKVYFMLHETEKAFCIDLAMYLVKALNQQMGLQLPMPRLVGQQASLFS